MSRLELQNLSKSYRLGAEAVEVLRSVSFQFPDSGSVAVLGRSGVGKSTLLHLIAGLDHASGGRILFHGKDIVPLADEARSQWRRENLGFIFQFHHLLPEFSAVENVAMPLWTSGSLSSGAALKQASEALEEVGLSHRLAHQPGELSGGEQQRVAIARALVTKPQLVLADEPTGNLDAETSLLVEEQLRTHCARIGALMIVVTHNQELASRLDFRLEMLEGGDLRQTEPG